MMALTSDDWFVSSARQTSCRYVCHHIHKAAAVREVDCAGARGVPDELGQRDCVHSEKDCGVGVSRALSHSGENAQSTLRRDRTSLPNNSTIKSCTVRTHTRTVREPHIDAGWESRRGRQSEAVLPHWLRHDGDAF